jgi:hypothetical protein
MESQATDLFQLAGTLVVDLRLDKSPDPLSGRPLSFLPDAFRKVKGLKRESHTLDDMRAMLGFAYLDSMLVPSEITQVVSSLSLRLTMHEQGHNFIPKDEELRFYTIPLPLLRSCACGTGA